jgi:hypothetical protein
MGQSLKDNEKCLRVEIVICYVHERWHVTISSDVLLTSHAVQVTASSISVRISLTVLLLARDLLGEARAPPRSPAR